MICLVWYLLWSVLGEVDALVADVARLDLVAALDLLAVLELDLDDLLVAGGELGGLTLFWSIAWTTWPVSTVL